MNRGILLMIKVRVMLVKFWVVPKYPAMELFFVFYCNTSYQTVFWRLSHFRCLGFRYTWWENWYYIYIYIYISYILRKEDNLMILIGIQADNLDSKKCSVVFFSIMWLNSHWHDSLYNFCREWKKWWSWELKTIFKDWMK